MHLFIIKYFDIIMRKTLGRVKGRTRKSRKSRRIRRSRIYGGGGNTITTNVIKPKPKPPLPLDKIRKTHLTAPH